MREPCRHFRLGEFRNQSYCSLGFYGGKPSPGVCLACRHRNKRLAVLLTRRWGWQVRRLIHSTLDAIEVGIRSFSRSRYRLGWIERVKACSGCDGRARWIDRHVQPTLWWRRTVEYVRRPAP